MAEYHPTTTRPARPRVTLRAVLDLATDAAIMGIIAALTYALLAVEVAL